MPTMPRMFPGRKVELCFYPALVAAEPAGDCPAFSATLAASCLASHALSAIVGAYLGEPKPVSWETDGR